MDGPMDNMDTRARELIDAVRDPMLRQRPIGDLQRLARRARKNGIPSGLAHRAARVSVMGGFQTSYIVELLPLFLAHRGIAGTIREAEYGALELDVLNPASGHADFAPDVTLVLPSHRDLRHAPPLDADLETAVAHAARDVAQWRDIWSRIAGAVVHLTFDPPTDRPLGDADAVLPGGLSNYVARVNAALADAAPPNVTLVDAGRLAAELGASIWRDPRLHALAKQPFAMEALPALCDALAAGVAAHLGTARKALIVDLDNTLWGGVIGDAGLGGLELGQETAVGESFLAFQAYLKRLAARGIPLCVCSKNARETALEPFREHAAMILREEDIACFVANFDNKADNIRRIAKTLNLGLDAFVFVDDSPVEVAQVRQELPELWTLHLDGDPSGFVDILDGVNAFPIVRLTDEDRRRATSYKVAGTLAENQGAGSDLDGFLRGLEPEAVIEPVSPQTLERITQLIAKTNQFKLNAKRFSAPDIEAAADGVIAVRLKDRLQDHGIVSVAVLAPDGADLEIVNWVMSCRVFNRRLEYFMRSVFHDAAREAGASSLRLRYEPSKRNGLIADLLPRLGFVATETEDQYRAPIAPPNAMPDSFMTRLSGSPSQPE